MGVKLADNSAKELNDLARQQLIQKVLADILIDMNICRLEGWDIMEFPRMIKSEIDRICEKKVN
ncbi:MAG: hypothetical protein IKT93_00970 [Clostridia bacterium]|nr:hypothetical protein [Clostridia bacterium]